MAEDRSSSDARERAATILVVDDTPVTLHMFARLLQRAGYDVLTAASGDAALAILAERGADLVLLDCMMPGLSGFEVLERIRATPGSARLPVLLLSAAEADDREVVERARALGASEFLRKPLARELLYERVRAHLPSAR